MMATGAVVGTGVGTLLSGAPFLGLQWLVEWTQDQFRPAAGGERYISGICRACPARCPVSLRMIGERVVKVETGGCPEVQLALQMLYHPQRITQPLKRTGKKGKAKFEPVSWEEAVKDIAARVDSLRGANKAHTIAAISSSNENLSGQLLERLLKAAGSAHFYAEASLATLSAAAVKLTQNNNGSLHYDFENSDFILSFGARLVEGWGESGRMQKAFAGWKARGARYVQVDTLCTRSAAVADQWIPIKAGSETVCALGVAYHLIKMGRNAGGNNFAQWSQIVLNDFTPERVEKLTGVGAETLSKLAREFAAAKAPVAVAGRGGEGVSSSTAEIAAVQALNSLVGSLGRRGGVFLASQRNLGEPERDAVSAESFKRSKKAKGLDEFIKGGEPVELLFVNEANPVHRSVYGGRLAEKMEKMPMVVAFMPLVNDTAAYADYVLPTVTVLESISQNGDEAVAPKYKSLHTVDALLKIAKGIKGIQNSFPWKDYKEMLPLAGKAEIRAAANFSFPVELFKNYLADFSKKIPAKDMPLALIPYENPLVGDGDRLALPYALKGLDGETLTGKKLWVLMNPETADREGVSEGSSIDIESKRGEIGSVKVHLSMTVAPDVIAVPLGFGHRRYTDYASGKGVNPKQIMSDDIDPVSGVSDWWLTRVKIS